MGLEVATFISQLVAANPTGADDYATADDHLRLIKTVIQGQFPNFTAAAVTATVADLNTSIGSGSGIYKLPADILTATPPVAEAATVQYGLYDSDLSDQLGLLGFDGSNTLRVLNRMHGGIVTMQGEDAAGVLRTVFEGNPNTAAVLYYAGVQKLLTRTDGIYVDGLGSAALGLAQDTELVFRNAAFVNIGQIGFPSSTAFEIRSLNHGGNILLVAEDAVGTPRTILNANPDGQTILVGDTDVRLQANAGEAVLLGVANGSTHIYANNILRATFGTTGNLAVRSDGNLDTENRRLEFLHQNAAIRGFVGYNNSGILQLRNQINGAEIVLKANDTVGIPRTILSADPDSTTTLRADTNLLLQVAAGETAIIANANSSVDLYYDNIVKLKTELAGMNVSGSITTADPPVAEAVFTYMILKSSNGVVLGRMGYTGQNILQLRNDMHGGAVELLGQDAAGVTRIILSADPDSTTVLRADTDLHLEVAAGELALFGAANGRVDIYYNNIPRLSTKAAGVVELRSDTSTDTEARELRFLHQDGTVRGTAGYVSSNNLEITNRIHGANVLLKAEDSVGTERTILIGDPDGQTVLAADTDLILTVAAGENAVIANVNASVNIFYNNIARFKTAASGIVEVLSDGNTDTEIRQLRFQHQNSTVRSLIGHETSDVFNIRNQIHGGNVLITAEDAVGTPRTILQGDPDGETVLRGDTSVRIQTAAGELAILCNNNGAVSLYRDNLEKFRTADQIAADIGMGAEVIHQDGIFYPVGMNIVPKENTLATGNVTISQLNVGKKIFYNSATARSILINNNANIPVGAMWAYTVGSAAGVLTGDGGTGVIINWWNGTGYTATTAAGDMTIGEGSGTIWKETDTSYYIDGPNLS